MSPLLFEELEVETEDRLEEWGPAYENIKSSGIVAETPWKENPKRISMIMEPIGRLKQGDGNPRIVLIALSIALAGLAAVSFFLTREFSLRRQVSMQLMKSEQVRSEMERSFAELKKEIAAQKQELVQMSQDFDQAKAKAALVDQQRQNYEEQIASLKKMYEGQISEFKNQLSAKEDLSRMLKDNLNAIRGLMQGAHTAELTPTAGAAPRREGTPLGGKVTLVDKRNRFVIVNLGLTDGISMGQLVQIYNGDKLIGEARIDRIYHDLSAATILSDQALSDVQKGDSVTIS